MRLDDRGSATGDRGGYAAVVPGDVGASELIHRITSDNKDERMPPVETGKSLSADEIELFKKWIDQGAEWSMSWAYVPPMRHRIPETRNLPWIRNWIDSFVAARHEQEGLRPSDEADRVTLIRRLSFDLMGLPPTLDEVESFTADSDPKAYDRLVDRLLASPHFGERMAMHWLDLVRFADTVGYHGDQPHNIWPYRDYVIHSFNTNKRFEPIYERTIGRRSVGQRKRRSPHS